MRIPKVVAPRPLRSLALAAADASPGHRRSIVALLAAPCTCAARARGLLGLEAACGRRRRSSRCDRPGSASRPTCARVRSTLAVRLRLAALLLLRGLSARRIGPVARRRSRARGTTQPSTSDTQRHSRGSCHSRARGRRRPRGDGAAGRARGRGQGRRRRAARAQGRRAREGPRAACRRSTAERDDAARAPGRARQGEAQPRADRRTPRSPTTATTSAARSSSREGATRRQAGARRRRATSRGSSPASRRSRSGRSAGSTPARCARRSRRRVGWLVLGALAQQDPADVPADAGAAGRAAAVGHRRRRLRAAVQPHGSRQRLFDEDKKKPKQLRGEPSHDEEVRLGVDYCVSRTVDDHASSRRSAATNHYDADDALRARDASAAALGASACVPMRRRRPQHPPLKVAVVPGIAVNLDAARVDALSQDLAEALRERARGRRRSAGSRCAASCRPRACRPTA